MEMDDVTFEEYYRNNDDHYRCVGTSYQEQAKRTDLELQEELELVEYQIKVITKWVNAVDQDTDDEMIAEYDELAERRTQLKKEIRNANNKSINK